MRRQRWFVHVLPSIDFAAPLRYHAYAADRIGWLSCEVVCDGWNGAKSPTIFTLCTRRKRLRDQQCHVLLGKLLDRSIQLQQRSFAQRLWLQPFTKHSNLRAFTLATGTCSNAHHTTAFLYDTKIEAVVV